MEKQPAASDTLPALVHRAAERFGPRPFIVTPDAELSFADADARSRRLARQLLADGVGAGTRVAMLFPQGPDWVVAFLAITRLGAIALPLSTFLRGPELARVLRHSEVHGLVAPVELLGTRTADLLTVAAPGLGDAGRPDLYLADLPHLRWVRLIGDAAPAWARATAAFSTAPDVPTVPDEVLDAIESSVHPADLAVMISTSGATADPKVVLHTHGAQVRHAARLAELYELTSDTRTLTTMPFFWVGGLTVTLLTHLHIGALVATVETIDGPSIVDLAERVRPTRLLGWTLIEQLREDPTLAGRDLTWIEALQLPNALHGRRRHGSLGMTETCGPHTGISPSANTADLPSPLEGSFGRPLPGVEHRIVDPDTGTILPDGAEGEICVRGDSLMAGIHKRERADTFTADGWYHTGDRGSLRGGLLFFSGRLTAMIKTAGANVAPAEVEAALLALDGVQAAFAVGLPDERRGEIVGCVVCPEAGARLDPTDLVERLRTRLSGYKLPRRIAVAAYDELPWLASGKISIPGLARFLDEAGTTP